MTSEWINDYVGVPYVVNGRTRAGWDCWGLIVIAFREQHGIELPDWQAQMLADGTTINSEVWCRQVMEAVETGMQRATEILFPETWAIAITRSQTMAHHAGIVIDDGQRILHCAMSARGTLCERIGDFLKVHPRTTYYRLNDLHAHASAA